MRASLSLLLLLLLSAFTTAQAQTGASVPEMANLDAYIEDFLKTYKIPGAAVAVSQDGRLIYARGFGTADKEAGEPVQPDSRFRIASISKPITAMLVMKLVEDGRLTLDAPAFALLPDLPAAPGKEEDPRLAEITVRDLLQHSGGWDRDGTRYDPMFDVKKIAKAMGVKAPAGSETIIRYMRGRPLDFDPGSRYAYSNFGYSVLGRIIEHVTGEPYETYARKVLAEAGIEDMAIGGSLLKDRLPKEVRYYHVPVSEKTPSVFSDSSVDWPYGGFNMEALDAHGAWVASAVDLLRFTTALDGLQNRPDLLSAETMAEMTKRPDVPTWGKTQYWYGLGWLVNTSGNWWHTGSLPGAESILVHSSYKGLHWAVLLNARTPQSISYMSALDNGMWTQMQAVKSWPKHDLFALGVASEARGEIPAFALSEPYPNPTRGEASVVFTLEAPEDVSLTLYDLLGREVAVVAEGRREAGRHVARVHTADLPSGVYLLNLRAGAARQARAITVVK